MRHKTFLLVVMLAMFAAFTTLGCRGSSTNSNNSAQFTFTESPWVNSNIIGRVP